MNKCCVCNDNTSNYKIGELSRTPIYVCKGCSNRAPLDTLDGFSVYVATKAFLGGDIKEVIEENKEVYESILKCDLVEPNYIEYKIEEYFKAIQYNNIEVNRVFNSLYKMSDVPPRERKPDDIDPMIYKIYVSPINNYYWCAAGYNRKTLTFYGDVIGSGGYDTTFTVDELSSYMAVEYKNIELPKRLSDICDELNAQYTIMPRKKRA